MGSYQELILNKLEAKNFKHSESIRKSLGNLDHEIDLKINSFLNKYVSYLKSEDKTIDYGIDCYLHMVNDMQKEQLEFLRNGSYSNSSFDEVNTRVYENSKIMQYHMHGLVIAQFLWSEQIERFSFFSANLKIFASNVNKYLEIGGGHGLYINEALELLPNVKEFLMVDISESSLDLAQGILKSPKIKYTLADIFRFNEEINFDFITMGEVLEHLEEPLAMLKKIGKLLNRRGVCYITTPINAPMIDHIYLFKNAQEIRNLFDLAGFEIIKEKIAISFNKTATYAEKYKTPIMFAAFIRLKN